MAEKALVGLAATFLVVAENAAFDTVVIDGLGKIGIKKMTLADRDAWIKAEDDSSALLMQRTVCDPDTGELSLKQLTTEQLKSLPAHVADDILKNVYKFNGIKTVSELNAEKANKEESEELKNSDPTAV